MHIAARIAALREQRPIRTTFDLAAAITSVVARTGARHPATRVFQALRIANDELGALARGMETIAPLAHGARFAVISFHSLEDRIVKTFFAIAAPNGSTRPERPEPRHNPARIFRLLTPHPMDASKEEIQPTLARAAPSVVERRRIMTSIENRRKYANPIHVAPLFKWLLLASFVAACGLPLFLSKTAALPWRTNARSRTPDPRRSCTKRSAAGQDFRPFLAGRAPAQA